MYFTYLLFRSYYEYLWKHKKGVSFDDLFQGMPMSLQADTSISLYKPIIDKVKSGKKGHSWVSLKRMMSNPRFLCSQIQNWVLADFWLYL